MGETIITVVIILGAAYWLVRHLRRTAKGEAGCSCGKCAKGCAEQSDDCVKSGGVK